MKIISLPLAVMFHSLSLVQIIYFVVTTNLWSAVYFIKCIRISCVLANYCIAAVFVDFCLFVYFLSALMYNVLKPSLSLVYIALSRDCQFQQKIGWVLGLNWLICGRLTELIIAMHSVYDFTVTLARRLQDLHILFSCLDDAELTPESGRAKTGTMVTHNRLSDVPESERVSAPIVLFVDSSLTVAQFHRPGSRSTPGSGSLTPRSSCERTVGSDKRSRSATQSPRSTPKNRHGIRSQVIQEVNIATAAERALRRTGSGKGQGSRSFLQKLNQSEISGEVECDESDETGSGESSETSDAEETLNAAAKARKLSQR